MTITLELSPETAAKIVENAKRQGISPSDFARRLLENTPLPEVSEQEATAGNRGAIKMPSEELTLFDRVQGSLQPFWDAEKGGTTTNYAALEEACDVNEDVNEEEGN